MSEMTPYLALWFGNIAREQEKHKQELQTQTACARWWALRFADLGHEKTDSTRASTHKETISSTKLAISEIRKIGGLNNLISSIFRKMVCWIFLPQWFANTISEVGCFWLSLLMFFKNKEKEKELVLQPNGDCQKLGDITLKGFESTI